jgi:hypothetical protein
VQLEPVLVSKNATQPGVLSEVDWLLLQFRTLQKKEGGTREQNEKLASNMANLWGHRTTKRV